MIPKRFFLRSVWFLEFSLNLFLFTAYINAVEDTHNIYDILCIVLLEILFIEFIV